MTTSDPGEYKFMTAGGYDQPAPMAVGRTPLRLFTGEGFKAAEAPL